MSATNEDFLFAQEAIALGYVTEAQAEEGFLLQKRMAEELRLDERLAVILVKRGWMGEEQARRVGARIEPSGAHEEIAGYRIVETLGRGAMGTVYKAVHLGLHRVVAIKVLRKDLAMDPTQVERLRSEAKILASLDHPNIVRALDAGESNGFPFVVMEYVEGESLRDRIARQGPLPEEVALRIARGIADALEKARRMGVVHRDVKPGNVLVTRSGEPKLMDLGLAKGPIDLGLTQHGATVGTPQYISPEQAQDPKKADTRSDIYSLGATLYAMLTGRPPFEGTTLAEILKKVLYDPPAPPRVLNREVSPEAAYLIERMMLKDPTLRYRTPAEVVRAIDRILGGASIVPRGFTGSWEGYLLRMRARRLLKVGGLTVALGILVGVGVALYLRKDEDIRALKEGEHLVESVLARDSIRPTDDLDTVRTKHGRAAAALATIGGRKPAKKEDLVRLERELRQAAADLERWAALEPDLDRRVHERRYLEAVSETEVFRNTVPGDDSPAERRALDRAVEITADSEVALVRLRKDALDVPAATWQDFVRAQEAYEEALNNAGFVETQNVLGARDHARRAVEALRALDTALDGVEAAFDDAKVERRAATFDLDGLLGDFATQRKALLAQADRQWGPLQEGWIPVATVKAYLDARLAEAENRIHRIVASATREAEATLEHEAASRDLDKAKTVPERLHAIAKALEQGAFQALALRVYDTKDRVQKALARVDREYDATYSPLVEDLIRDVREGRSPEDLLARIRKAEDAATDWPDRYRANLRTLSIFPEGLADLYDAAVEGLAKLKKAGPVRMRDGTLVKRVDVLEVHPAERAVTAMLTRDTRPAPPEKIPIASFASGPIVQFARAARPDLRPHAAAVAIISQFPEREAIDLRPALVEYRHVLTVLDRAGRPEALVRYLAERADAVSRDQQVREDMANRLLQLAGAELLLRHYPDAHFALQQLLRDDLAWHWTVFFDQNEARVHELASRVAAQLVNVALQNRFPGTVISGAKAAGADAKAGADVVTTILFTFESTTQLESFRKEPGRGWAVLEPYVLAAPTTPEARSGSRLHLLRGLDEQLTRDLPLSLPSPYDPALRMTVEWDHFTQQSPVFLAVDLDGLQVGILSLDPTSPAYAERFRFPEDVPLLDKNEKPPVVDFYGRGRGVAFHAGPDFGDPPAWDWTPENAARQYERWADEKKKKKDLPGTLFAFEPMGAGASPYRVKVVRDGGRLTLYVNDREIASDTRAGWSDRGQTSDRVKSIRGGTGRIQILTWTPQAIDNLAISGVLLERYREKGAR